MVIGIIGGGASGMAAAIAASENRDDRIILLERQARVGRKLSATGNGRCNLTNLHAGAQSYHGEAPEFAAYALLRHDVPDTIAWFRNLGLLTVAEESGRVYPWSDQANSVVDVLRFALERENIEVKLAFEVEKVKKTEKGFQIRSREEMLEVDRLIIACGGLAGTKLGGSMSGYQLLHTFGHKFERLRPTLVQIKSSWQGCPQLKGVRANCHARILRDGALYLESAGEIQFTDYGLSGPVIFEISRDVCRGKGSWSCQLDLLPDLSVEALTAELVRRTNTHLPVSELLTGILHNRLGRVTVQEAGFAPYVPIAQLEEEELALVARTVKSLEIPLTEPMGMDAAQVTAGGILTADFNPETMESRLVPGLYACGEVLDIDGDCGGYNLQWAWSSGRLAGESAGKE